MSSSTGSTSSNFWGSLKETDVQRVLNTLRLDPNIRSGQLKEFLSSAKCMRGWSLKRFLSNGTKGFVFVAGDSRGNTAAIKIQLGDSKEVNWEVKMQKKFQRLGIGAKIVKYCSLTVPDKYLSPDEVMANVAAQMSSGSSRRSNPKIHIIIMEKIDGVLSSWVKVTRTPDQLEDMATKIVDLAKFMRNKKVTHGDFHLGNIGYVFTDRARTKKKLILIDFARSYDKKANAKLEWGALQYAFWERGPRSIREENRMPFRNRIADKFNSEMGEYWGSPSQTSMEIQNDLFKDRLRTYIMFIRGKM